MQYEDGKVCLATGIKSRDHRRRKCRKCKAEYQRRWRSTPQGVAYETSYQRTIEFSPMAHAKTQVNLAVRKGKLPRVSTCKCVDCGKQAQIYDHRDYSRPFEVEPVCCKCNARRGYGKGRGFFDSSSETCFT